MRCLSVRQPWADLIREGVKTIELRTWTTKYRGLLVICAASNRSRTDDANRWPMEGPLGVARALVRLEIIRPAERRDRGAACRVPACGEHAWVLTLLQQLDPVPVSGQLGLFAPSRRLLMHLNRRPVRGNF